MLKNNKHRLILGIISLILITWLVFALVASGTFTGIISALFILWGMSLMAINAVKSLGIIGIITWFAEKDVWWSPIRMEPGPGNIIIMVKGFKPSGPFDCVLAGHIPHWRYHEGDRRFYKDNNSPIKGDWKRSADGKVLDKGESLFKKKFPNSSPPPSTWLDVKLKEAGAIWVGYLRRYYQRKRRWEALDLKKGGKPHYDIVLKETKPGEEHIFYFSTLMAVDLETVPTKDNYPAQMKIVENILLIHPEKAEILGGKWEVRAVASTKEQSREYIARKLVAELREERDTNKKDDFLDHILFANEGNPASPDSSTVRLLHQYGVIIEGPSYVDFDLESGDAEMTKAMKRQMIATEDVKTAKIRKEETVTNAEGEKERMRIIAEGARESRKAEAEGIREEFAARMSVPEGADLSWAEAVKTAAPKYISLGRDGKGGIMVGVDSDRA